MKPFGAALLVAGIVLVVMGVDASRSVESRLNRFFTGSSSNRTMYLLVGGAASCALGAGLLFGKGK